MCKWKKSLHSKSTNNASSTHKKREEEVKAIRKATRATTTGQRISTNPRTNIATPTKTVKLATAMAAKDTDKNDVHTESLISSIHSSSKVVVVVLIRLIRIAVRSIIINLHQLSFRKVEVLFKHV